MHSAAELEQTCEQEFPACDVLLMAAAVADFRPTSQADGKIKKGGRSHLTIELEPTPDVLSDSLRPAPARPDARCLRRRARRADGLEYARAKLAAKGVDAWSLTTSRVRTSASSSTDNEVTILTGEGDERVPRAAKELVAERILDTVERLREGA